MMNPDTVIARQVKENYELRDQLKDYKEMARKIHNLLFCIGGPLNDNREGYSQQQLGAFFKIHHIIGSYSNHE
jgi:hypothetical protein